MKQKLEEERKVNKLFEDYNSFSIEDKEKFLYKLVEYYGGNMIAYLNALHIKVLSRKL